MAFEYDLVVHATHEAGVKVGGIGAVLNGLLGARAYVEHVAPLLQGRLRPFTQLPADAQDRVLRDLESSSSDLLRAGFQALKALAFMALYRREDSWSGLRYPGPTVRWEEQ